MKRLLPIVVMLMVDAGFCRAEAVGGSPTPLIELLVWNPRGFGGPDHTAPDRPRARDRQERAKMAPSTSGAQPRGVEGDRKENSKKSIDTRDLILY